MPRPPDQSTQTGHRPKRPDQPRDGEELHPGTHVGSYVIDELRSSGGFASIYRATHVTLKRLAALKVLHQSLTTSKTMIQRFLQEAQAANLIRHPNIIDIYEFGELTDGRPYLVMEWLEGRDLENELRVHGPFSPSETLALTEELGSALAAAHAAGIVHRDLKASNVLVVPAGDWYQVKLVDFGIAKLLDSESVASSDLTTTGVRVGTPWNMAPEQILGHAVDCRTDIYALGLLLYQLLTGVLPFRASTPVEVEELHLRAPPPRLSEAAAVPAALDRVVDRCLQKDPADRYASVGEMLHELRDAVLRRPSGTPSEAGKTMAIGFYIEARVSDADAVDDDVLDDLESVIAIARRECARHDLQLALDGATALMFVSPLPPGADVAIEARERAVTMALALYRALAERPNAGAHVRFSVTLQIGSLLVVRNEGATRMVGGDLLAVSSWPTERAADGVTISAALEDGLQERFVLTPLDAARSSWQVRGAKSPT